MAPRYSLTIQINPNIPGHAAVVVNEPSKQTYAGFGPQRHYSPWSYGKFDVHSLAPGQTPPADFSSVAGAAHRTFTVPITEEQATQALNEIQRISSSSGNYNVADANVCTAMVNRIMEAAGLGSDLLYLSPLRSSQYLSDVEKTLIDNPRSKFMIDGAGRPAAIPQSLRGVQQDYAFVGGGYDTPSERNGHLPSGPIYDQGASPTFDDRYGKWSNLPEASESSSLRQSAGSGERRPPDRYLRGRQVSPSGASVFDTGTSAVPFAPDSAQSPPPSASFDQRFGGWAAPPQAAPVVPAQMQRGLNSSVGSEAASGGRPLPVYPAPPMFGGYDPSTSSGDDWFSRWIKPLMRR
ncbi:MULTISPECIES: hypothetical protein [unclassified Bradyrhizobium]|uniref:hypothetical protein n=1 Tax=unclassified Bradyrhizobium TaxID=2631580 RepID=UPI0028EF769C|nr:MULTISPECIES: hypothetical protein [unclassified Bradyrhizobium]